MPSSRYAALLLLCLALAPLAAEDTGWVIAAEKFTSSGIPALYEPVAAALPGLVLERLAPITSRLVRSDEQTARQLTAIADARLKLIKERADLVLTRDKFLLSVDAAASRNGKIREVETKIALKEKAIADSRNEYARLSAGQDGAVEAGKAGETVQNVSLWKEGRELYQRKSGQSLSASIRADGVSALLSGTMEDLAGYLFVTVTLDTGLENFQPLTVSDAAPYDEIESLAASLAARLLPSIANRGPVTLRLSVDPEGARVFVDERLVHESSAPLVLFSGEHTVRATADGYRTAVRTADFSGHGQFSVRILLEKDPSVRIAFDTGKIVPKLYLDTAFLGETPLEAEVTTGTRLGEAIHGDAHTWFVLPVGELPPGTASPDGPLRVSVSVNLENSEKRIETQRSRMYWSLAALYLSLPFSMLSYGTSVDMYQAWNDGKLPDTQNTVNEINAWSAASLVTRGISIGLGVNFVYRLVKYLVAADQVVPKTAGSTGQ